MMRAVLETNVVVSALIWGGLPCRFIDAAKGGMLCLVTSPALIAELEGVLKRPHLARVLEKVDRKVLDGVALCMSLAALATPVRVPRVVPGDANDDKVVAAAVVGAAEMIVTGDKHLLDIGVYEGIHILRPAAALREIVP